MKNCISGVLIPCPDFGVSEVEGFELEPGDAGITIICHAFSLQKIVRWLCCELNKLSQQRSLTVESKPDARDSGNPS